MFEVRFSLPIRRLTHVPFGLASLLGFFLLFRLCFQRLLCLLFLVLKVLDKGSRRLVREVVEDGVNGRLLARESIEDLVVALQWLVAQSPAEITKMKKACLQTAHEFSLEKCAERALKIYVNLVVEGFFRKNVEDSAWTRTTRMIQTQWDLVKNLTIATGAMISPAMGTPASSDVNHPSSVQSPETTKNNDTESLFVNQP